MKFRFLGDLSSFEYKPKPEIKTLDYKEGCAITSLKTSLNKDIDYYKWKIFDTKDNFLEGHSAFNNKFIEHLDTDDELLSIEVKAYVNDDLERLDDKRKKCIKSLQDPLDKSKCLCSEKTFTSPFIQMSNAACGDALEKDLRDLYNLVNNKMLILAGEIRKYLRKFITDYEKMSLLEKEENKNFLPYY